MLWVLHNSNSNYMIISDPNVTDHSCMDPNPDPKFSPIQNRFQILSIVTGDLPNCWRQIFKDSGMELLLRAWSKSCGCNDEVAFAPNQSLIPHKWSVGLPISALQTMVPSPLAARPKRPRLNFMSPLASCSQICYIYTITPVYFLD